MRKSNKSIISILSFVYILLPFLRIKISDNLKLKYFENNNLKLIAIFLVCFASVLQSKAQCSSFNVIVVQNDLCNSDGIINVVYSHPYTIEVQFPNFTTATFNSTQDTISLTGLFGGDYTITTQDVNNCSETITLTSNAISSTVFSPTFFTNGYNVNCYGDCNGQIYLNLTNLSELYTIDWYLDSVFGVPFYSSTTDSSFNSSSQNNLCAGEYVFLFTAQSGCQSTRNFTLREPDSLIINGTTSVNSFFNINNYQINVDVTGGVGETINSVNGNVIDTLDYTFSWTSSNGFTSNNEDITNNEIGDYSLTVTDANGCIAEETFNFTDTSQSILSSCTIDNTDNLLYNYTFPYQLCDFEGYINIQYEGDSPYSASVAYYNDLIYVTIGGGSLIQLLEWGSVIINVYENDNTLCDQINLNNIICVNDCQYYENDSLNMSTEIIANYCQNDTVYFDLSAYIDFDLFNIQYWPSSPTINQTQDGLFYFNQNDINENNQSIFYIYVYDQYQNFCDYDTLSLYNITCNPDCNSSIIISTTDDDCFNDGTISISNVNQETANVDIINLVTQQVYGSEIGYNQNFTFLANAGEYLISAYYPSLDCFYNQEINISDNNINTSYFTNASSEINSYDGSISMNIFGGVPPYIVYINGPNTQLPTQYTNGQISLENLISGQYIFNIYDSLGCTNTNEIYLNYIPMLYGCTDSNAINYNPLANFDDGSCDYCNITLVSSSSTFCNENSGYIEVSTFSNNYEFNLQILINDTWVDYNDGCFDNLIGGASWSCLPADTFRIIGFGPNQCLDTLSSTNFNLTEFIENDQLNMNNVYLIDDQYSDIIPIGFPFEYKGNSYTECLISSNNYISFDILNFNSYSQWSINNPIPNSLNPTNTIMAPYQDLNPAVGGEIEYTTYGIAPNRIFIVRWKNVPMFSCTEQLFSSTLYLFESSNIIETHIEYKPLCDTWNQGAAIHGLQDINGFQADVVFDNNVNQFRNFPVLWTTSLDGYQFIPNSNGLYDINNIDYGVQYSTNIDNTINTVIDNQYGCTDNLAINFNELAICDDGSCEYPLIYGCTDSLSNNFNPEADIDDGSCCYLNYLTIVINNGINSFQDSWNISNVNGDILYVGDDGNSTPLLDSATTSFYCLATGCYEINLIAWEGGSIELYYLGSQFIEISPAVGSNLTTIQFCLPLIQTGCTDPNACNFQEFATEDDGSCEYPSYNQQEIIFCDYIEYNGQFYDYSFSSTDTLNNFNDCDSILTTFYVLEQSPNVNMLIDFIENSLLAQTDESINNYSFNWNTGDTTSIIYPDTNGYYSVEVFGLDNECSTTSTIYVSWLENTSIEIYSSNNKIINIYPNPSYGFFNISIDDKINFNEIEINVKDINSRVIYESLLKKENGNEFNIDIANFSKGIYFVYFRLDNMLIVEKLIKN